MSKVILITGASSGIGKSIGEYLTLKGMKVYGTSRDSSRYLHSKIKLIDLDVKSKSSIELCINNILKVEDKIDVLINNAGVGITGPLEEIPQDQIIDNFKTNLYGPINLIKEILPIISDLKFPLENFDNIEKELNEGARSLKIFIKYYSNSTIIRKKKIDNDTLFLFFNESANFDIYKDYKNFVSILLFKNTGLSLSNNTEINSKFNKNLLIIEIQNKNNE